MIKATLRADSGRKPQPRLLSAEVGLGVPRQACPKGEGANQGMRDPNEAGF